MGRKFLHSVNLEEERKALEDYIAVYTYFLDTSNGVISEKAYYEGLISSLQKRLRSLDYAPKDKNKEGNILLKCAITSSKQKSK